MGAGKVEKKNSINELFMENDLVKGEDFSAKMSTNNIAILCTILETVTIKCVIIVTFRIVL